MRKEFDEQLERLNTEMIKMGSYCEYAIGSAMKALFENDTEAVKEVEEYDREINQKEREIESMCLKLLLKQQPVAHDLRTVSSALRMIADLERVGDQSEDIAEITKFVDVSKLKGKTHIKEMSDEAINMLTKSVDSFVKKDVELAKYVILRDDVVDNLFNEIKEELITCIAENKDGGEAYLDLFMVAKYLERIGDHATNIAEWVIFSVTGKHIEEGNLK